MEGHCTLRRTEGAHNVKEDTSSVTRTKGPFSPEIGRNGKNDQMKSWKTRALWVEPGKRGDHAHAELLLQNYRNFSQTSILRKNGVTGSIKNMVGNKKKNNPGLERKDGAWGNDGGRRFTDWGKGSTAMYFQNGRGVDKTGLYDTRRSPMTERVSRVRKG